MVPLKRILVLGAYGTGNWGDEFILQSLSALLGSAYPGAQIRAFSYDPERTARVTGAVTLPIEPYRVGRSFVARARHGQWREALAGARARREADRALEWAQLLILGGGNMLVDEPCYFLEHFTGQVVARAARRKLPIAVLGVGFGPVNTSRGWALLGRLAGEWACTLAVREASAARALERSGARRVHLTADPVLLAPRVPSSAEVRRTVYGVSARPLPWEASPRPTLDRVVGYLRGRGPVSGLAFHPEMDLDVLRKSLEPGEIAEASTPLLLAASVTSCAFVAGMRLHSLVLAAACGIPVLGLAYHDKVVEFMERLGTGHVLDLRSDGFEDGAIERKLAGVIDHLDAERGKQAASVHRIRRAGLEALRSALEDLPFASPPADCWAGLLPAEPPRGGPILEDRPVYS